jgi:hypothetical protein
MTKRILSILAILVPASVSRATDAPVPDHIQFNRDVRPILSENCFACHGFDKNKRKADLRLDTKAGLTTKIENGTPVVPGKPDQSLVYIKAISKDPDEQMPPPSAKKPPITAHQAAILKKWIEQGAVWEDHWSFTPVKRPATPAVKDAKWVRNPIDAFILARLEKESLKPAAEADKVTLIRRVTLDLTGLPPTPKEVDDFLADKSPDAYEKVVDRLLTSVRCAERLTMDWLDAARYADTHGYHIDSGRDMTRWREWVINAFQENKPYDQFTVEQLAGDLLPNATLDQKIASGFNRNSMINFEGGAFPEEYRTAYVIDRVNTTGTVWLGLTVGCTQCHDHKFDPITQKEYYQLFAYFNSIGEKGLDGQTGNAVPLIATPSADQQKKIAGLTARIGELEKKFTDPLPEADAAQAEWEKTIPTGGSSSAAVTWHPAEPSDLRSENGATMTKLPDHSVLVTERNANKDVYEVKVSAGDLKQITGVRLEALPDVNLHGNGPGRSENGNFVLTGVQVGLTKGKGKNVTPLTISAASASFTQRTFSVESTFSSKHAPGWAIYPEAGKAHEAIFELASPAKLEADQQVVVTLEFKSANAHHQLGHFRLALTDGASPAKTGTSRGMSAIFATPVEKRTAEQKARLRDYYRKSVWPEGRALLEQLGEAKKAKDAAEKNIPSTMVMQEMEKPRDTFVLMRGAYDKHGEQVTPGVPAFLPPLPKDAPPNRLALAKWLVDRNHPLTSRVTVNRYWQMVFGTGIVKSTEDFGSQGELPSHPELLDYLAADFMETGWDVRRLIRNYVTSSTYRQASTVTPELLAKDPENRLLARGTRYRLSAETIRDQALAAAGLLDSRVGGHSVSPYQPPGLWEELMSRNDGAKWTAQVYEQSHGADLYRRTMYTFWKRTCPPPTLVTFDAPDREVCTVRRARTNTPLQALVLMNDPTYVEASRKLAERALTELPADATRAQRITFAFREVVARAPSQQELAVLQSILDKQQAKYSKDKTAAENLLKVGESPRDPKLDSAELASWTTMCGVILNLDEAVTRG